MDITWHNHVSKLKPWFPIQNVPLFLLIQSVRLVWFSNGFVQKWGSCTPISSQLNRESSEKPLDLGLPYFLPTPHFYYWFFWVHQTPHLLLALCLHEDYWTLAHQPVPLSIHVPKHVFETVSIWFWSKLHVILGKWNHISLTWKSRP